MQTIINRLFIGITLLLTYCGGEQESATSGTTQTAAIKSQQDFDIDLLDDLDVALLHTEHSKSNLERDQVKSTFDNNWRTPKSKTRFGNLVIGVGESSSFELFVAEPRDVELKMVCTAMSLPEGKERIVNISIGGHSIGRVNLQPDAQTTILPISASFFKRGINTVVFKYGGPITPVRIKGGKESTSAYLMSCSEFEWRGLHNGVAPARLPSGGLRLSAGSGVEFFEDLPPNSSLILSYSSFGDAVLAIDSEGASSQVRPVLLDGNLVPGQQNTRKIELSQQGPTQISIIVGGKNGHVEITAAGINANPSPTNLAQATQSQKTHKAKPNIIIYLVDTLRRDRLSTYGYQLPTSPFLDEFTQTAIRFDHAVAQAPWTTPAVASLFTGVEPQAHGANYYGNALPPKSVVLAEMLADAGYQTIAFSGSKPICRKSRFDQGFDVFNDLGGEGAGVGPRWPLVIERVEDWLKKPHSDQPVFMYVHTTDPHSPYDPPRDYKKRFAPTAKPSKISKRTMLPENLNAANQLYDGEVAFADAGFGRFIAALKQHKLYDNSVVIFMADHGEQFLEHKGWRHESLWGENLNIPLVIKLPVNLTAQQNSVTQRVSQIDLMPTIAELAGVACPHEATGQSLLPLLFPSNGTFDSRPLYSYVKRSYKESWSLIKPPFKLVWRWFRGHRESHLFDLESDPKEQNNLSQQQRVIREHLKATLLRERIKSKPLWKQPKDIPSDELVEQMKALGYVK